MLLWDPMTAMLMVDAEGIGCANRSENVKVAVGGGARVNATYRQQNLITLAIRIARGASPTSRARLVYDRSYEAIVTQHKAVITCGPAWKYT